MSSTLQTTSSDFTTLSADDAGRGGPSGATILIVDDIAANARILERLLTREGHHVIFAADGEEALERVRQDPPDLILMDVMMPTLDGFSTCQRLKSDPKTRLVPVVLITALQGSLERIRGLEVGADDFLCRPVNNAELTARVRSLLRIKRFTDELDSAESVILSLALTIEARDVCTVGHCQRLAKYAVAVGRGLRLNEEDLSALWKGGFLHDIGKVGIADSILLKPAPLTADETTAMQQHTIIGDRLCGELKSLRRVRPIVRSHHERPNGTGYPDGLKGDAIPLLAQIMSVVDVFDALTTTRPYKPPFSLDHACDELNEEAMRGWWNPDLVDRVVALARSGGLIPAHDEAGSARTAF